VLGLLLFYFSKRGELEEQQAKNSELEAQIKQAQAQSENIGEVEQALAKSKQLEEVVMGLQAARQGPARLMLELSKILSEGGGPTIDPTKFEDLKRTNPLAVFNSAWDVRRLWITGFRESDRKCQLSGYGKTNEDVAEFLRRLNVSEVFDNVQLRSTAASAAQGLPVVQFAITCEVKY
jgi:type IV pilus assembly protein PilN